MILKRLASGTLFYTPLTFRHSILHTAYVQTLFLSLGYDCGVFICMFAYFLSAGRGLEFSQNETEHCRRFIALSILRGFVM